MPYVLQNLDDFVDLCQFIVAILEGTQGARSGVVVRVLLVTQFGEMSHQTGMNGLSGPFGDDQNFHEVVSKSSESIGFVPNQPNSM